MKKVLLSVVMVLAVALGVNGAVLIDGDAMAADNSNAAKSSSDTSKNNANTAKNTSNSATKYTTKAACEKGGGQVNSKNKCNKGTYKGAVIVTKVTKKQCGTSNLNKKKTECSKGRYQGAKIVAAGTKINSSTCTNNGGKVKTVKKTSTQTCSGGTLDGFTVKKGTSSSSSGTTGSLVYTPGKSSSTGVAGFGSSTSSSTGGIATAGSEAAKSQVASVGGSGDTLMDHVSVIINVIIGAVGLVAVVMVVIGGLSFVTSQGDANKVAKARNTVLYGIVGLVIAVLAFAIVNFVLSQVFTSASNYSDATSCSDAGYTWDVKAGECK